MLRNNQEVVARVLTLKAPVKGFYTFESSAHSPLFEEPERMQRIIQEDVLRGVNNLSDLEIWK